jgi:protein involved in polysaccharide export with SLBB domain
MRLHRFIIAATLVSVLSSCQTVKNVATTVQSAASHIPLPDLKMPSMRDVANLIPGMPENDQVGENDPEVPFNSHNPLQSGHTLRLEVYEGTRDPSRVFRGLVMVDDAGHISLGQTGYAKVGGKHLPEAVDAIGACFRVTAQTSRPVTVHVFSVENTPLIGINGDVQSAEYMPAFQDINVKRAVEVAGGRRRMSTTRGVYINRSGQRRFFTTLDSANDNWKLRAGDVITLSPDI